MSTGQNGAKIEDSLIWSIDHKRRSRKAPSVHPKVRIVVVRRDAKGQMVVQPTLAVHKSGE